jgi:glycosyltransferase involved in cell wall biosynthesis
MAELWTRGVEVRLFLVGDGPRRPLLEGIAQSLGLSGRVHFLGRRLDVPGLYARATAGVLCSTHEGMSNAVIEGMASRLPMVVTRAGGNIDLIEDGLRGRLVDSRNPSQLADAIAQLLAHPGRAKRLGEAARRFVETELTMEKMVSGHDQVYRRLLERPCA